MLIKHILMEKFQLLSAYIPELFFSAPSDSLYENIPTYNFSCKFIPQTGRISTTAGET